MPGSVASGTYYIMVNVRPRPLYPWEITTVPTGWKIWWNPLMALPGFEARTV